MLPQEDNLKEYLDKLYEKYCVPEFIKSDPIQFVYVFDDNMNKEISGFLASVMSQGKRKNIISKTKELIFDVMGGDPLNYILKFDFQRIGKLEGFSYFSYRNITGLQLAYIINSLKYVLNKWGSLKNLFYEMYKKNSWYMNIKFALIDVVYEMFSWSNKIPSDVSSLVPNPSRGSACKRLNMFLRWMVRKDKVDTGLWNDIIPTSKLVIPLDFHVSKISRELNLTKRSQDDWITAEEITEKLKVFDPNDPVKYDFAIFGYGVNK
ncbi:MAG: TIGR02757 family protein [Brevinematia bacterium]